MAGGGCEGTLLIISGCPGPLVSVAGWIKGALGTLDRDEAETGRGSWGRDSELDEDPTLLHDSEPAEKGRTKRLSSASYISQNRLRTACVRRELIAFSLLVIHMGVKSQR